MAIPARLLLLVPLLAGGVSSTAVSALPQQSGTVDLLTQANVRVDGATGYGQAATAVARAGDVNGDGRDDVILGAPQEANNGRTGSGSAYVLFGSASLVAVDLAGLDPSQGFRIDGAAAGDQAGTSVAGAGDVNGDGRDDVLVGSPGAANNGRASSGSAHVVFGSATPGRVDLASPGTAAIRIDGAAAGDTAGSLVSPAGDPNGDGIADVMIGAPAADNNSRGGSGSVYVVFGGPSPADMDLAALGAPEGFRIDGAAAGGAAGTSAAAAGDVNADGYGDLVVGAPWMDRNSRTDSGTAYVVFGTAAPTSVDLSTLGAAGFRVDGGFAGDRAGHSVAGAGDLNGDGREDVIIGAPFAGNNGRSSSGSAYVIYGSLAPTSIDLYGIWFGGFRIDGGAAFDRAGGSVGAAGDINGDGRDDVVVGAQLGDPNGRSASGSAYVVFGSAPRGTLDLANIGSAGIRIDGASAGDQAGVSVAAAGDVNGDGRDDVITGAAYSGNNGRTWSGSAYVAYGFGTPAFGYTALSGAAGAPITPHLPSGVARTGAPVFSVAPSLPAGMSLDPMTGMVSGTPTYGAVGTFTVTMTDLTGSVTALLPVNVTGPNPPAPPPPSSPDPAMPGPPAEDPGPVDPAPGPRSDARSPTISLRVPVPLRAGPRLRLRVRCDEDCRLVVRADGAGPAAVSLRAGGWAWIAVPVTGRTAAPRSGGPARLRLTATDAAGNRSVLTRNVRTVRSR